MQVDLHIKLKTMLCYIPEMQRMKIANEILLKPVEMFRNNDQIFIKAHTDLKVKFWRSEHLINFATKMKDNSLINISKRL